MSELMIKVDNVKKEYRLGAIGGTTLRDELARKIAKAMKKEDPTKKIGAEDVNIGERFMALNGVSFEVKKGEAVGIIGHNGAGKSTLLKLITRITAPTEGNIYLNGRIASMLEVGTGFHPELTGRENVYLNGAILGMTKKEIDAKMEQIIDFSEVRQFIDTPVKRYSSGMYVKLAFSVASHLDSEIMVMDEVLAVGDVAFQNKCIQKMREVADSGRTILYVSHNMSTIRSLCDRCVVLSAGKVIFAGEVDDAIEVYMNSGERITSTDVNLKDKRMKHLSKRAEVKMSRLKLLDKRTPVYEFGETIDFDLHLKVDRPVKGLCARLEVRTYDDSSVGAGVLNHFMDLDVSEDSKLSLSFTPEGLVPGDYHALLVVYEKDELGAYNDLDAIYPAFDFSIVDNKDALKINWNHRAWGKVKFETLKYRDN